MDHLKNLSKEELTELLQKDRDQIAEKDENILREIHERNLLASRVGILKELLGLPLRDEALERKKLMRHRIQAVILAEHPEKVEQLFSFIMAWSFSHQVVQSEKRKQNKTSC